MSFGARAIERALVTFGEPDAAVRLSLLHAGLRDQARALDADRRAGGAGPDGVPALRPGHDLRLDRLADQDAEPEGRQLGAVPEEGLVEVGEDLPQRPHVPLDALAVGGLGARLEIVAQAV